MVFHVLLLGRKSVNFYQFHAFFIVILTVILQNKIYLQRKSLANGFFMRNQDPACLKKSACFKGIIQLMISKNNAV